MYQQNSDVSPWGQPPDYVLKEAKNTTKFFKCIGSVSQEESGQVFISRRSAYQALTEEEYEARELKKPSVGKEYFSHMDLEDIVNKYPYRKNLPEEDMVKERLTRLALIDFLRGLVEFDPAKRWSPLQASKHPFVTGEPFRCPYEPAPETPRMPCLADLLVFLSKSNADSSVVICDWLWLALDLFDLG
ncbi:unnamed protein product [Ilex paraguariensis]|uniref:Uncharacterized protein n=1 Tax=Ilex paraguariensis TaxID=185542 RepID=A0ABC8T996_9AQUA